MVLNPFEVIENRLQNIEDLLIDLRHNPQPVNSQPELEKPLTVSQAAKYLSLSVPTVYTLISKGELPVKKRSKRCYFFASDLYNYLKEGSKKTNKEIEEDAERHLEKLGQKKVLTSNSKKNHE